jgi:hypothetical protein
MVQTRLVTLKINKIPCFKKAMIKKNNKDLMGQSWIVQISIKVIYNNHWSIRITNDMKEDKSRVEMGV